MAKQSTNTPAAAPWESWGAFPVANVMAGYNQWLDAFGKAQQESFRFVQERLDKNARLVTRLAQCRTGEAALSAQAEFMREAMEDCLGEFGRIAKASAPSAID